MSEKKNCMNLKKYRTKESLKAIKIAEKYFYEEKYGRAMPLLFKYEDCEARAMLFLAFMYFEGVGAVEDMAKGVKYLQKLVTFENVAPEDAGVLAIGLHNLGELYFKGIVLPKDDTLAEEHWLRGAKLPEDPSTGFYHNGSVQCQSALGMFYSNPEHLDLKKAFRWHRRAQRSGNVVSEGALGVMYLHGIGIKENPELAYKHLSKAASLGNTFAQGHLAAFFYKRHMFESCVNLGQEIAAEGDPSALAKKQECPLEHVKRGLALGCFYLALCIQYGYGVSQDTDLAKHLIQKAVVLCPNIGCETHEKAILILA